MNINAENLPGVCFHRYNYAPPEWQEEGIGRRIRQGVGGPYYLESGAEIEGHLHVERGKELNSGDVYPMKFLGQTWNVEVTYVNREKGRMEQDDPEYKGYAIQGKCIDVITEEEPLSINELEIWGEARETYLDLRKSGLNLIEPREAKSSLDPDAPRTLIDLLGESSHRARKIYGRLYRLDLKAAEEELEEIRLTWLGLEFGALEVGDEKIADFIRNEFVLKTFGPSSD